MIEHLPTGSFYFRFGGEPNYVGDDVTTYFVDAGGDPVMLQRAANPSSRQELEERAAKARRKAEREAEAKERRRQLRARAR